MWKVLVFRVTLICIFLHSDWYSVSLYIQSEGGKMRIRTTPNTLTFYGLKMVGVYLKNLRNNGNKFPKSFFFSARFARGVFRTLSKIWDGALFISSKQFLAGQLLSQPKLHLIQPFVKILNTPLTYLLKISNVLCRMSDSELLSETFVLKMF